MDPSDYCEYHERGFLLRRGELSPDELACLHGAERDLVELCDERVVRERDGRTLRSVYGIHSGETPFARLGRSSKLLDVVQSLLEGEVYLYQSKLNVKQPLLGERWEWHQDYAFWAEEDGMPTPRVLTAAVFLDEITEFNGALAVLPGSHTLGLLTGGSARPSPAPSGIEGYTSSSLKYTVETPQLLRLADAFGLFAPKGPAGSVLFFAGALVHASGINLSPRARRLALYTYNRVDNAPTRVPTRPWFLRSRETTPLTPHRGPIHRAPESQRPQGPRR